MTQSNLRPAFAVCIGSRQYPLFRTSPERTMGLLVTPMLIHFLLKQMTNIFENKLSCLIIFGNSLSSVNKSNLIIFPLYSFMFFLSHVIFKKIE